MDLNLLPVLPARYTEVTGEPAQIGIAVFATLTGVALVVCAERWASRQDRKAKLAASAHSL